MNQVTPYQVMHREGPFEIRRYPFQFMLKGVVPGPFELAVKNGRSLLKVYFEGHNFKKQRMATPNLLMLVSRPEGWEVSCKLDPVETWSYLPKPLDQGLRIVEVMPRQVAALNFLGSIQYETFVGKMSELERWISKVKIDAQRPSQFVMYERPLALPFFQKNEIHIELLQ